jgi:hypothetical protein
MGEQPQHEPLERLRHVLERGRITGRMSAEQLVERDPERVQVAARRHLAAAGLLGRRVQRRAGGGFGGLVAARLGERDAEVAECGLAVAVEPHVVGLDVAVDDPVGVRVGERQSDLAPRANHLGRLQPARGRARQAIGERAAGHVAGDQARRAVVVEDVVHRDDVPVTAEPGGQPRLAPQPLPRRRSAHARERDRAVEREVMREPDVLRAAAAEPALQQVAAGHEPLGRVGRGCRGLGRRQRATRARRPVLGQDAAAVGTRRYQRPEHKGHSSAGVTVITPGVGTVHPPHGWSPR